MEIKKLKIALVVAIWVLLIAPSVISDTQNVTVRWYIPSDLGISIQYPAGLSTVDFRPASMNFTNQSADGQAAITPVMNITNIGNVDMNISANFTATALPEGTTFVNISDDFNIADRWYWTNATRTTLKWIISTGTPLAPTSTKGFWMWSSGVNVVNTSYPISCTLVISSVSTP